MATRLLLVFLVFTSCHGEQLDMDQYQHLILKIHNDYRREEPAANMNMLQWSDAAESAARQWVQSCNFAHQGHEWGENLAFRDTNNGDIVAVITELLGKWHAEKSDYTFGQTNCGAPKQTCHYTQMIWGSSRFIGCAINKCDALQIGSRSSTLPVYYLACFYKPRSYAGSGEWDPYIHGTECSKCAGESTCDDGLCLSTAGEDNDNGDGEEGGGGQPGGDGFQNEQPTEGDALEPREKQDILNEHNILRKGLGLSALEWDDTQEGTANYVINCEVEYGGYPTDYVNNGKAKYGTLLQLVLRWIKEGPNLNLKGNGCRSLNGGADCSHFSNMVQPDITKMGCSSKACGKDVGRQLTCLYTA